MIETTNGQMQHAARESAMRRNPCDCYELACDCPDRTRSIRLVDYARYGTGEARRVMSQRIDGLYMSLVNSRGRAT